MNKEQPTQSKDEIAALANAAIWKTFSSLAGDGIEEVGIKNTYHKLYYGNPANITTEELQELCDKLNASQFTASKGAGMSEMDKARFWAKVRITDYCWIWEANKNSCGYGQFKINGRDELAPRVAYEIIYGEIPGNLHVLHQCDNPICVNPTHLVAGTHQDNMLDKMRKGRGKVLGRASKYHGVAFRKDSNNWRAQVFDGRKHVALGSHKTQEDAAKARDKYVLENNLDLPLNFAI